jgi:hypothetical protein
VKVISAQWEILKGCSNSPSLKVIVDRMIPTEELRFKHNPATRCWWAQHEDWVTGHFHSLNPVKQEGYGGCLFKIIMEDGREQELWGPWHGNTLRGAGLRGLEVSVKEEASNYGYCFGWFLAEGETLWQAMNVADKSLVGDLARWTSIIVDRGDYHQVGFVRCGWMTSRIVTSDQPKYRSNATLSGEQIAVIEA